MNWKLPAVLLLAFGLRVTGIGFGLYHPDEHLIVNHSLAFGTGDLNPHMFYFPSLFLYLLFFVYGIFYAAGHVLGHFPDPNSFLNFYLRSPEVFYVLGRLVSVVFGTLTVWAVYCLGKEYQNARTGLIAALFMAVCFLPVRDSHFATMDTALVFFMVLSMVFILRAVNLEDRRPLYWGAVVAGVASAIKYNAFILALPLGLAYVFVFFIPELRRLSARAWSQLLQNAFVMGFLMLAAFFAGSPYFFLDFKNAAWFVTRLYGINQGFHIGPWHHARMLFLSMGPALAFASVAGFLLSFKQGWKKNAVFAVLPFLYYGMITKAGQPFERYILALVPFCVVWAASLMDLFRLNRRLVVLVAVLSALPTFYSDFLFLRKDTRDLAREWVESHVTEGDVVVFDDPGQGPRLSTSQTQLERIYSGLREQASLSSAKTLRLERLIRLEPPLAPSYNLHYLSAEKVPGLFTMLEPEVAFDVSRLRQIRAKYVFSDHNAPFRQSVFYEELGRSGELAAVFDPRRDDGKPMSRQSWTYLPIDAHFWNFSRPGPLIRIYKVTRDGD